MTKRVQIFTDGACSGNPGPGGWGAILRFGDAVRELSGGEALTTNNRMELLAAINGLDALKSACEVDLYTDSKYVMDGIEKWIHGWKRNGWKTADKKPVKNGELWQALDAARQRHKVILHWVKGHAGHAENERADELAREGMAPFKPARAKPDPVAVSGGTLPPSRDADRGPRTPSLARKPRRSTQSY